MRELWDVLWRAKRVVDSGNWVCFDTETTSLEGEIIEWAVCTPDGTILGQGRVKPTQPITEGAYAKHGITLDMLQNEPTFDQVVDQIYDLFKDKMLVGYNVSFDVSRFFTSIQPYYTWGNSPYEHMIKALFYKGGIKQYCAMEWFAVVYGDLHEYFQTYTWQKLETACAYFNIEQGHTHNAASDAQATVKLVHKLAEMAKKELPTGYHPPRKEPCAGGCGQTLGPFFYDEDKMWYCLECGLVAGHNHLCPRCSELGKRTIVTSYKDHREVLPPDKMCYECEYEVYKANGTWHICPRCTRIVQATMEAQKYCKSCNAVIEKRKEAKRASNRAYRARREATVKDIWIVREWYRYGKWDRHVDRVLYFEATSRKEALELYHAQYTPKFPGVKLTASIDEHRVGYASTAS